MNESDRIDLHARTALFTAMIGCMLGIIIGTLIASQQPRVPNMRFRCPTEAQVWVNALDRGNAQAADHSLIEWRKRGGRCQP